MLEVVFSDSVAAAFMWQGVELCMLGICRWKQQGSPLRPSALTGEVAKWWWMGAATFPRVLVLRLFTAPQTLQRIFAPLHWKSK